MLLNFSVENFRSFSDQVSLSMVASTDKDNSDNVIYSNKINVLKSAVIYGSNGAGKSNLIKAFAAMKEIVLSSSKEQRGDKIKSIEPFIFNGLNKNTPTLFEVIFVADGIRYQYGFTATQTKVHEEWLFAFPKSCKRVVFHRYFEKEIGEYLWDKNNGKYLNANKEKMDLYKDTTRDNELFLSKIVQLNNKEVTPVYDWFNIQLKCAGIGGWNDGSDVTIDFLSQEKEKKLILKFLSDMDIGVDDIDIKKEEFDISKVNDSDILPKEIKESLIKDLAGKTLVETHFLRKTENQNFIPLEISEESDGTQKIFSLLGPFMDALKNGYVLVIDELHNSLHPLLLRYLVQLFHNKNINTSDAQLIFTTHETEILNQDVFRRDQIWFVNKDYDYSTNLVPLTDYSPRKAEKLSKGYLSGRYGGIPSIEEQTKLDIQECFG